MALYRQDLRLRDLFDIKCTLQQDSVCPVILAALQSSCIAFAGANSLV